MGVVSRTDGYVAKLPKGKWATAPSVCVGMRGVAIPRHAHSTIRVLFRHQRGDGEAHDRLNRVRSRSRASSTSAALRGLSRSITS